MKDFKAILWDNDGVLVDTEKLYFQANFEILAKLKIDLNQDSYREHFLVNGLGLLRILGKLGYKTEEIEQVRNQRNDLYSSLLKANNNLIPGVFDTLEQLSKTHRMAIVTGSRKDHFEIIHQNTNILQFMEFVVAQGDFEHTKPHPEPYLQGLKQLRDINPKQCLAIEDTERGLISAKKAGLSCWVIPNKESKNSNFSLADKVLQNISEVKKLLLLA